MITRWQGWLLSWVDLAVAMVVILSLGWFRPRWGFDATYLFSKRNTEREIRERDEGK